MTADEGFPRRVRRSQTAATEEAEKPFNSARSVRRYQHMKRLLFPAICLAVCAPAFGQTVSVRDGNIQFTDKSGKTTALTSSGRDSNPVLAPDRKWVAFVRKLEAKKIATGSDEVEPTELWQVRVDGKEPSVLVRCRDSEKMESVIGAFDNLQFSFNGKLLYFVTPAWATSGAVHVVDTTSGKERYVFPGNDIKVVKSREYKDCLLVQQHRYFVGSGSYDWYWLLKPDGKEVGPVGEDTSNFDATYGDSSDKARTSNKLEVRETVPRIHHSPARRVSRRDDAVGNSVGKNDDLPRSTAPERCRARHRSQRPDDSRHSRFACQFRGTSRSARHPRDRRVIWIRDWTLGARHAVALRRRVGRSTFSSNADRYPHVVPGNLPGAA